MRPYAELDVECFSNWFLVGITDRSSGARWDFHAMPHHPLDLAALEALLRYYTIVTFNGEHYDLLMVTAALNGYSVEQLKWVNDQIIKGGKRSWENRREFKLYAPDYIDHVDLMEVLPGVAIGLKVYAGRAHAPLMLDSPVNFDLPIPYEKIPHETYYCQNDREVTGLLREQANDRLQLRIALSAKYGVDLRSKSDAQIAEAVVLAEWRRRMEVLLLTDQELPCTFSYGYNNKLEVTRRYIVDGYSFKYEAPPYIEFVSPHLQELLATAQSVDFVVRDKEQLVPMWVEKDDELVLEVPKIKTGVQMPKALHQVISIGGVAYQMGIGGLHSRESCQAFITDDNYCLQTIDVASYYPSLMTTLGMTPAALGSIFLEIYEDLRSQRLVAKKRAGEIRARLTELKARLKELEIAQLKAEIAELEKELAEVSASDAGIKTTINGTFGKLWSKYSIFFAPELGVRVTITGQLLLLMLIERLVLSGIQVISANTDGLELRIPRGMEWVAENIIQWWERRTGLVMEASWRRALYSRDVNNYIAIDEDGKVKRKGVYRPSGVVENKNPNMDICADAVCEYLANHTPIHHTIRNCTDIRKFVVVRKVKGGGYWRGEYLGGAVRWYHGIGGEPIVYENGNKVASSDGAYPIMRMDGTMPGNIDFDHYIKVANDMLTQVGFDTIPF